MTRRRTTTNEGDAPDTGTPATPDTDAPDTDAPSTDAPDTDAPEPSGDPAAPSTAPADPAPPVSGPLDPPPFTAPLSAPQVNRNMPAHPTAAAPIVHNAEAEHIEIVDAEGKPVAPGDMFTSPEASQTVVFATQRLFRVFRPLNSRSTQRSLLYPKGARVGLQEVARVHALMATAATTQTPADDGTSLASV